MISAKEYIALHAPVARAIERREQRLAKIEICPEPKRRPPFPPVPPFPDPDPDPRPDVKRENRVFVPGSVTVFVARSGSRAMKELRAALLEGEAATAKVIARYQEPTLDRKDVSIEEASKMLLEEDVFGTVLYGGRELATHLFLPKGVDLAAVVMPYAGGALASGGLTFRTHAEEGTRVGLEAVAVRANPILSAAEAAAIKLIPRDQLGLNIGQAAGCDTTGYAVAAVVVAVALVAIALATTGCVVEIDRHLDDQLLKRLGPRASLGALMDMRRDAITNRVNMGR